MLELAIPAVVQATNYTCGPAALLAALRYLGVGNRVTEKSLAREMGTTDAEGTSAAAMLEAAGRRWSSVDWFTGMTIGNLQSHVDDGDVVILDLQAWSDEARPEGYLPATLDGHYVVATAVTGRAWSDKVVFMDPSSRVRVSLPVRELHYRWYEVDSAGIYYGGALVLSGVLDPKRRELRWDRVADMR